MNKKTLFVLMASFMILAAGVSMAATSVVFYEYRSAKDYKSDTGYSSFKQALVDKGYSVSKMEISLSREALDSFNPDVLVIPELSASLEADELAAIFEFVMQDGKGLFVLGAGCDKKGVCYANQITIPFGMSIDEGGILEDENSQVMQSSAPVADKTFFVVSSIERQDPMIRLLVQGVNQLAFFGGNGIELSGDAMRVATGDWDTYSPKSSTFPKGSKPPIASSAMVGGGLVFLLSDADMLSNTRLDKSKFNYDNLRFGTNIIDWLRSTKDVKDTKELDELRMMLGQLTVDLDNMNRTTIALEADKASLQKRISDKDTAISALSKENADLKSQSFMGIKYTTLAIGLLGFAVLAVAVMMSQNKKKPEAAGGGEAGGFGYEFDEAGGGSQFGESAEGFDDLMDMNKKKG